MMTFDAALEHIRAAYPQGVPPEQHAALARALAETRPDVVSAWAMGAVSLGLLTTVVERGLPLVLVDDVVTSGATLTEAAGVLAAVVRPGGPPVLAAVVAATPREPSGGGPRGLREAPGSRPGGPADRLSGRWRSD